MDNMIEDRVSGMVDMNKHNSQKFGHLKKIR